MSRAALKILYCAFFLVIIGCAGQPSAKKEEALTEKTAVEQERSAQITDLLAHIRLCLETGTPTSLNTALNLIKERSMQDGEYGRSVSSTAYLIFDTLYADSGLRPKGEASPPVNHPYARVIADVKNGVWTAPADDSADYMALILPCLVLTKTARTAVQEAALPYLQKARKLNPKGVLALYFTALVNERLGKPVDARILYNEASLLSDGECYPAFLGIARLLSASGKRDDAIEMLLDLKRLYPDNIPARRLLTQAYIAEGKWTAAESEIAYVLSKNYNNPEFLLLEARVFVELQRYNQAIPALQTYVTAGGNETSRDYRFVRARLEWEGNKLRSNALSYLRAIVGANPQDSEAALYLARLLLGSNQAANKDEGRAVLQTLLKGDSVPLSAVRLAFEDAVARSAWSEAALYAERIPSEDLTLGDMQNVAKTKLSMGDRAGAEKTAREANAAFGEKEEAKLALIDILSTSKDARTKREARSLIDAMLPSAKTPDTKGKLYYYKSRLSANEEDALNDLRASLLETPRNLDALLAIIAIYEKRSDERRVGFYMREALLIAPNNAEVQRLKRLYDR